ncbi:hypothetical protein KIPB_013923, partial [Kipferlia bialata]
DDDVVVATLQQCMTSDGSPWFLYQEDSSDVDAPVRHRVEKVANLIKEL